MPLVQPDINLVYRKSTTPTTNTSTAFKGSPLTNDELDNNFYGINVEMKTKAPINEAVFTGSTTIPNIVASGGTINGTTIGGTTPAAGSFTTLTTNGNLTVGDSNDDILSIRAGTALLPSLTTVGDLNTGMWFPAADTIAWSTNGVERLRIANAGLTVANDLTVTGDVAVNGGDLTTSSATFNLIDSGASTVNFARSGSAITIGATTGTTTIRNNVSITGTATLNNSVTIAGSTTAATELFRINDGTTTKFEVDSSSGNTAISGTLGVTGNVAVNTDKFTVTASSGNTTIDGTLGIKGNVAVNTDKFTVTASSGNTVIAGTLNVTGGSTISTLNATTGAFSGQVTSTVATGSAPFVVASTTRVLNLNADRVDDFTADQANTASTIVVRDASKNININNAVMSGATSGTTTLQPAAVSGTSVLTLPAATDTLVARATTDTLTNKTLTSPTINTATISGGTINNAPIGGTTRAAGSFTTLNANSTLDVTGATTLNSTLQVEAATTLKNNVTIAGSATPATEFFRITDGAGSPVTRFLVDSANGNTTISGDVAVNTDKFTVTASSGNTVIAGTLNVTGGSTISTLIASSASFSGQVTSTVATGTAPLAVTSTTLVTNLNADLLDGLNSATANTASTIVARDASRNINISNAVMSGATSGTTTLQPAAVSGTSVLTLPAATDTIVARATTDTLTNKSVSLGSNTLTGTLAQFNTALSDADFVSIAGNETLTNKTVNLTSNTLTGTLAQFNTALSDANFVSIAGNETLTNKTLTSPTIDTATISGGTINNAPIGGTTRAAGAFTTLNANSTLDVTGATALFSTLAVSSTTTLNNSVTLVGSSTPSSKLFRINDGTTTKFEVDSSSGNTVIAGALGVSGAASASSLTSSSFVQGTVLTSTTSTGTAPLTVASSTKVTNLHADKVDNFSFTPITTPGSTQTAAGSVAYVTSVTGADYDVGFTGVGTNGNILTSTGGSAPQWVAPTGFSAGSARSSGHIDSGNNGDLLYQKAVTVNITTTANSDIASVPSVATSGIEAGQILIGNPNFPAVTLGTGSLPYVVSVNTVANTIKLSLEANASATTLTKFLSTSKLSLGTTGQVLTAGATAPEWSNSISVTGALTHGGLSPSAGTNIDQVYTVTDSLTLNTTEWFNTTVNTSELATGSYMVQVNTGTEYYTGIMSWYAGDTSLSLTDEIILHRASAGTEILGNLFLKVERTDNNSSPDMTVQISSSVVRPEANYTLKFRRML